MSNSYLIICYYITSRCIEDVSSTVYEKVYPYDASGEVVLNDKRNKTLSAREAHKIISTEGLTLVVENRHGKIF